MLNIFNEKLNNYIEKKHHNLGNKKGINRHYPPANIEWLNSIYAYNKNTTKLLPVADKALLKLIKSYFNLYNSRLEKKIKYTSSRFYVKSPSLRLKLRRLSIKRVLVSRAELKHTSDKVNITIYIYSRHLKYYIKKIKRLPILNQYRNKPSQKKLKIIVKKGLKIIFNVLEQKKILFKTLNQPFTYGEENYKKQTLHNSIFNYYENKYLKFFILKSLRKEIIYLYLKQIIFINKFKFKSNFLLPFTFLIKEIYNKKIEFNLVNLKYLYLNSYIFTDTIVKKIRNRKNSIFWVLKKSLMFKIPPINRQAVYDEMYNKKKIPQNLKLNQLLPEQEEEEMEEEEIIEEQNEYSEDNLDLILKKKLRSRSQLQEYINSSDHNLDLILKKNLKIKDKEKINMDKKIQNLHVTKTVLDSLKYKFVKGIRIETAGRLTRRYTAAKSIYKMASKGNIQNMESSLKGLSTVLLRGYLKSNLQYTKLSSLRRIGSFGVKGWVSGSN